MTLVIVCIFKSGVMVITDSLKLAKRRVASPTGSSCIILVSMSGLTCALLGTRPDERIKMEINIGGIRVPCVS